MQKELTCSMLEVTEQSGGEEEVSVLHGWLLWQLPLLWVQAPLHPLPCHSHVAVQPSELRSHSAAPATLKTLFILNTWRTNSLNHCSYAVAETTDSLCNFSGIVIVNVAWNLRHLSTKLHLATRMFQPSTSCFDLESVIKWLFFLLKKSANQLWPGGSH